MITETELNKLKEHCKGNQELTGILSRVDFIVEGCITCVKRRECICEVCGEEIPAGWDGPCEHWDYIPF